MLNSINFEILNCIYQNIADKKSEINFLENKAFFSTIENLKLHGFNIKKDSVHYYDHFNTGLITIEGNCCEMTIRLYKKSCLCKKYILAKNNKSNKDLLRLKLKLINLIKNRINIIYKALFEGV